MAINTITGTSGPDDLTGTNGEDKISGLSGDDDIQGKGGLDHIYGGEGDDRVDGGDGGDDLHGDMGEDRLFGGAGNDILDGNDGYVGPIQGKPLDDVLSGGAGSDTIYSGYLGFDRIDAGTGDDLVVISDARRFGAADGGDGFDTLSLSIHKNEGLSFVAGDKNDGIDGFEQYTVKGGRGVDHVTLGAGDDEVRAWHGNDVLEGRGGQDRLNGGADNDRIDGGAGDDRLTGRNGTDHLTGGGGADWFQFDMHEDSTDRIADFEAGIDHIGVSSGLLGDVFLGIELEGPLDPARFHEGVAVGTEGQFVLVHDGDKDRLFWDANGIEAGGKREIAILQGDSGLTADDITISGPWMI